MKIIGCDFHPSFQQIAVFDPETGEIVERRLLHADGEVQRFYGSLSAPVQRLFPPERVKNNQSRSKDRKGCMRSWLEKQLGSLLAIAAVIWATYHVASVHGFEAGYLRLGPMQLLMAGLLLWLHGKYRESVHVNRA